jgi:hypothetical protein
LRDAAPGPKHPKSWRGLLPDAARAGPKTVEIAKTADSRANSAAIDTAGVQAKLDLIPDAARAGPKAAPHTIDAARRASPGSSIAESAGPGPRPISGTAGGVADTPTNAVRPSADMAGSDDQRQMLANRARSAANAGAGDAPAPIDDRSRSRSLSMSKNHGAANESSRQG